jgi:prolyl oligopeptidase
MSNVRVSRALCLALAVAVIGASAPPLAKTVPYSETFFGTVRNDPYHWMESNGTDLVDYIDRQSAYTQSMLANNAGRPRVVHALQEAEAAAASAETTTGVTRVGARVFYLQTLPGSKNPSILARDDGQRDAKVVVNAASLPADRIIAWFEPSPQGTKIAYGATASSEAVTIHVCNIDGSHDVTEAIEPKVIPDITWRDEKAFYYSTVIESEHDRTGISYLHTVGSGPDAEVPIAGFGVAGPLGSPTSRDLFTRFVVLGDDVVLAMPQHDVTPHTPVYVAPFANASRANAPWRRIFDEDDDVVQVAVVGRRLYALSDRGDGRRTILVRDRVTGANVRTIPPHDDGLRTDIFANRTGVYVEKRVGAEMRLEHYGADGSFLGTVALPTANVVRHVHADPGADTFAIETGTFNDPGHWYEVRGLLATVSDAKVSAPPPPMYTHFRAESIVAVSADGTKIPCNVISTDGTPKDGKRPTLLIGYGAYGASIDPPVPAFAAAALNLGVVIVLVHARGGGEFGEAWHLAGKGPTKQHTIDDFVAGAHAAIDSGWTSSAKLAGLGASAGAIAIGGAITQHPDLFAVGISEVGLNDMVDFEHTPNGPGNVPEFGSVKTADGFRDLLAMSAYDHVVPAAYPAMILTMGRNDRRAGQWEVAKMAARLQAATTSGKPILLRADAQGHGIIRDVSAQESEDADIFTFMLSQMNEPGFTPA